MWSHTLSLLLRCQQQFCHGIFHGRFGIRCHPIMTPFQDQFYSPEKTKWNKLFIHHSIIIKFCCISIMYVCVGAARKSTRHWWEGVTYLDSLVTQKTLEDDVGLHLLFINRFTPMLSTLTIIPAITKQIIHLHHSILTFISYFPRISSSVIRHPMEKLINIFFTS